MKLKIALLPGDGIGPEVTNEAVKVLKAIASQFDHTFIFEEANVGAIAIEKINVWSNSEAIAFNTLTASLVT